MWVIYLLVRRLAPAFRVLAANLYFEYFRVLSAACERHLVVAMRHNGRDMLAVVSVLRPGRLSTFLPGTWSHS